MKTNGQIAYEAYCESTQWKSLTWPEVKEEIKAAWEKAAVAIVPRTLWQEDLLEQAWGIIANAGGGDWGAHESEEWVVAARMWRDKYHGRPSPPKRSVVQRSVVQEWTYALPMMQQTVLLTGIRGPDGIAKYGSVKMLLRWYRRCVLLSAMDGRILPNPYDNNGGSFTGPSLGAPIESWEVAMNTHVDAYLRDQDALPHHFQMHFMHASEILGYKHPDERVRAFWNGVYLRLVNSLHLHPETEAEMDERLGDCRDGWLRRADRATTE